MLTRSTFTLEMLMILDFTDLFTAIIQATTLLPNIILGHKLLPHDHYPIPIHNNNNNSRLTLLNNNISVLRLQLLEILVLVTMERGMDIMNNNMDKVIIK